MTVPADSSAFPGRASWIELNGSAARHNIEVFRSVLGRQTRIAGVLKANAYGHGLRELLPAVHDRLDAIDVITAPDALAIRRYEGTAGLSPRQIVVLGTTTPEEVVELARQDVDVVLADDDWQSAVAAVRRARLPRRARLHIHLDSGLGREGFTPTQLPALCDALRSHLDVVEIAGVLSHFANTEDVTEQSYAESQLDVFESGFRFVQEQLQLPPTTERHFAASAASLVLPRARFDVVRVGVSLYGLWPSTETRISARLVLDGVPALEPVLTWKCPSQTVKRLPAGAFVGYGCTWRCPVETTIAVLPVGYSDGYPRLLSSRAHVLVNGARCPVLGRVMMNHIVVDITRAAPAGGPIVATLLGRDGADSVPAELLAEWAQTINYEVVARLGAHLRRTVIGDA